MTISARPAQTASVCSIRTELEVGLQYPDRTDWERTAADSLIEVDRLERLAQDLRVLTNSTSVRSATVSDGHTLRVSNDGPAIVRNILRSMGASIRVEPLVDGVCFVADFQPRLPA